jgi:hypothetical protein
VVVVRLILGTSPVLDVVAVTLHDAVDSTRWAVLAVVLCMMPQHPLLVLTVVLVDVAAGVACTSIPVEVGAEVVVPHAVHPRLVRVVLIDLLLYGGEFVVCRSIRSTV